MLKKICLIYFCLFSLSSFTQEEYHLQQFMVQNKSSLSEALYGRLERILNFFEIFESGHFSVEVDETRPHQRRESPLVFLARSVHLFFDRQGEKRGEKSALYNALLKDMKNLGRGKDAREILHLVRYVTSKMVVLHQSPTAMRDMIKTGDDVCLMADSRQSCTAASILMRDFLQDMGLEKGLFRRAFAPSDREGLILFQLASLITLGYASVSTSHIELSFLIPILLVCIQLAYTHSFILFDGYGVEPTVGSGEKSYIVPGEDEDEAEERKGLRSDKNKTYLTPQD